MSCRAHTQRTHENPLNDKLQMLAKWKEHERLRLTVKQTYPRLLVGR